MQYVMLFSVYFIYVTAIASMCFANKHIIIIKYYFVSNINIYNKTTLQSVQDDRLI